MEFLEDYDFEIHYHPGKANVVTDALSRKSLSTLANLTIREWKMRRDVSEFDLQLHESSEQPILFNTMAQPTLVVLVLEAQLGDPEVDVIRKRICQEKEERGLKIYTDSSIRYLDQLFVPTSMRNEVLRDFHHSHLAVHLGGTKMYHDLSQQFWWRGMKKDVALIVSKCLKTYH
ncbi:uncharacterized protein LOC114277955 [Camellia sinensis]|uniref:uncharacterized protein LOC114277955 n=1 Tax=Camellia sinensis TaxID=4442 RepID=UPI00103689BE|nr:uncharacterized protein LOC114277955 [Camellia sinensis]